VTNRRTRNDERVATGVPGLDDVLRGGLPVQRLFLIQGAPGSGKTTIALQFLLEGVRRGERCLYVTLSESEEEIEGVAASHGWSFDGIDVYDLSAIEHQLEQDAENTIFHPAEVELHETTRPVLETIAARKPQRVVFDSLSELRMLAVNPLRYRRRILALKQHLAAHGCTTLFLDDGTSDPTGDLQLQSLAHGVIEVEQRAPVYGRERRQLRIVKMRGVKFVGGYHDFAIERGGARVFARLVAAEHSARFDENELVKSGLPELDALLGGGPTRGTSTLVVGPAGSGKSMIVTQYAHAAAMRGEKVAMFLFEESRAVFLSRARGLGLGMEQLVERGQVVVRQIDPAEMSPSEFVQLVRAAVEDEGARCVVIDSLNGYLNAMPEERFLTLQLHELLSYLGLRGVATFLVMVQHGIFGSQMAAPVDVSYVADNVLLLRFFEANGRMRKALSVVKKRTGNHEATIRALDLSNGALKVGAPLEEFHGVLTGVPVYTGDKSPSKGT
jgi:circadian clock protein KaiC